MKNKFILILITSVTFLSMTYKNLEPVKCLVGGNNSLFDVHLKINGVSIKNGYVGNLKIMNENHPLKEGLDNMPSFMKDELAFVLKEGENNIELEFKRNGGSYESNGQFTFSLTRSSLNIPLYYFSSRKDSGKVTSKFYIQDKKLKENYTSLGNTDASFIASEKINYFQAFLNDESLMSFGGTSGITDLDLIEDNNKLEIKYKSAYEGEFSYYIKTPNFTKKVIKNISKDQLNKTIVDVYEFKK